MRMLDFGDHAIGIICDADNWGGANPAIIRPRRRVSGKVIGLHPMAPNVVRVRTEDGTEFDIRRDLA